MRLKKRYNSLFYYTSDLIDSVISSTNNSPVETSIVIPNMGSGVFFRKTADKFPILSKSLDIQKKRPGEISTTEIFKSQHNNVYFCQLYSEKQQSNSSRSIDYIFLCKAMLNLRYFCFRKHTTEERRVEIHLPKSIASVGGRWSTVADLIEDCWVDQGIPTFIYRND